MGWNNVRASILVCPVLLLSGAAGHAATQGATPASKQESAVDPQARDALKRMSEYFKSLPGFSAHEEVTREQVINGDLKVQKASTADILVRRPDHLKAVVVGDEDKSYSTYFDGKTLTLVLPTPNYYAQMDAPGNIGAAIDKAESEYGVEFPAPNFLRLISGTDFASSLTAAGYVGKSKVGDDDCEHYAYRTADVDYQVWIQNGDRPLARKLVITSKKLPTQPEYSSTLTWDLSPKLDDESFAFAPPPGATKIPFGSPPTQLKKQPKK
jgi:hypothetical protein